MPVGRLHNAEVGSVVLESDGEGGDAVGCRRDREGVLDAQRGLENRHEPDGTGDAGQLGDAGNSSVDLDDLCCGFDLGNQDEVGRLRHDLFQIGEAERQLVDAHHALGGTEVHGAKRVADQQAGGVFLGMDGRSLRDRG